MYGCEAAVFSIASGCTVFGVVFGNNRSVFVGSSISFCVL